MGSAVFWGGVVTDGLALMVTWMVGFAPVLVLIVGIGAVLLLLGGIIGRFFG